MTRMETPRRQVELAPLAPIEDMNDPEASSNEGDARRSGGTDHWH
jgi:hypothetical protein